jgi:hypothetical protein
MRPSSRRTCTSPTAGTGSARGCPTVDIAQAEGYGPAGDWARDGWVSLGDSQEAGRLRTGWHEACPANHTSEFAVWFVTIVGILIAGAISENLFSNLVWILITATSFAYIVSRGIAKAGAKRGWGDVPPATPYGLDG